MGTAGQRSSCFPREGFGEFAPGGQKLKVPAPGRAAGLVKRGREESSEGSCDFSVMYSAAVSWNSRPIWMGRNLFRHRSRNVSSAGTPATAFPSPQPQGREAEVTWVAPVLLRKSGCGARAVPGIRARGACPAPGAGTRPGSTGCGSASGSWNTAGAPRAHPAGDWAGSGVGRS